MAKKNPTDVNLLAREVVEAAIREPLTKRKARKGGGEKGTFYISAFFLGRRGVLKLASKPSCTAVR
jgi:hypothetical protein